MKWIVLEVVVGTFLVIGHAAWILWKNDPAKIDNRSFYDPEASDDR